MYQGGFVMKNEVLKQIINQVKTYNLTEVFEDIEEFNEWLSKLNDKQIDNFLGLTIAYEDVHNWKHLLINHDLLNCDDYKQRVYAISKLKNGDGCWHLFDNICDHNFLKSLNFYKDLEIISKADTARYSLWVLNKDIFINSPYHSEDLKLITEAKDVEYDNEFQCDWVIADALATVASNIASINSPYHRKDMQLIANSGSRCLQASCSYPCHSLNNLAINEVSLLDKYHLENMKILATNPISSMFLYKIMTDPKIIEGKNYRKEVEVLANAKSKHTARALYYYIVNPENIFRKDRDFYDDYTYDIEDACLEYNGYVSSKLDPDYIENLVMINQIDDKFVMHYVSLLLSLCFINSNYKKFDLELLRNVSSKPIFMDLYRLMLNETSLNSIHHRKDAILISQMTIEGVRDLLLEKACCEYSLKSINHEYDMEFISKLRLDNIREKIYDEIYYYLFDSDGINDPNHRENLEKLLSGNLVERNSKLSNYLDSLENQIAVHNDDSVEIIKTLSNIDYNEKSKTLKLNRKHMRIPSVEKLIEIEESLKNDKGIENMTDIELYCLNLAKKIPLDDILEEREKYLKSWFFIDEGKFNRMLIKKYSCTEKELFDRFCTANKIRKYKEKSAAKVFKEQKRMIKVINKKVY